MEHVICIDPMDADDRLRLNGYFGKGWCTRMVVEGIGEDGVVAVYYHLFRPMCSACGAPMFMMDVDAEDDFDPEDN